MISLKNHLAYFSGDYLEARTKFINSSTSSNWQIDSLTVDEDQQYYIDVSHSNLKGCKACIVVISGTHGVEGYLGSAIQLAILENIKSSSNLYKNNEIGLILVHALNPFGMNNNRQLTKENINLNRNFILTPNLHHGCSEQYKLCDYLLNPKDISFADYYYFLFELAKLVSLHGYKNLKSALACGQYEYPQGLFFGGKELALEAKLLINWLNSNLVDIENILCIDIHSGLGPWAYDSLLGGISANTNPKLCQTFCHAFKNRAVQLDPNNSVAYQTNGGLIECLPTLFKQNKVYGLVQEFGTYNILKVLYNIRLENYNYNFNTSKYINILKEIFCPSNSNWRRIAIDRGLQVYTEALRFLITLQ